MKKPYIDVVFGMPKNFFNKEVNETFIKTIMENVLEKGEWVLGNPNNFEPDYFYNNNPFEFTIASDTKRKNNFVQRFKTGKYTSEDAEKDLIEYILKRVEEKSKKEYSTTGVHLCILCLIESFLWVSDKYGSFTHCLSDIHRKKLFETLRKMYIETERFKNIFIIFPDLTATWWVWDVLTGKRASWSLDEMSITDVKYPFYIERSEYDKIKSKNKT